jgi:hypothetical protein
MTHDGTASPQHVRYCFSSKLLLREEDWADVHPDDRAAVRFSYPRGWQLVCFRCLGRDGDYHALGDGLLRIRVRDAVVKPVPTPRYAHGQRVHAKRRQTDGVVRRILWHLKRGKPYYLLEINARESGFRYFECDLDPAGGVE